MWHLETFARTFFPEVCRLPFSPLHEYLFERRRAKTALPLEQRRGALDVVLAPRGAAKSTLVSLVFPLHALLNGLDTYILLISATERQATRRLANLRAAVESEGELARRLAAEGLRTRRFSATALEIGPVRIEAVGAGCELRGISHGPWRPTWIILDDVERGDRIRNVRHRDALSDWFGEVIENLGDRYTNIDIIGTLLHPDALPARLEQRPDAVCRRFASILSEAGDAALWGQWRDRFHNLADPDRLAHAREFFGAHREAMLAGSSVLWPEKEDYYALTVMRETRGCVAFNKEKQNDPAQAEAGMFSRDRLRWFRIEEGRIVRQVEGVDEADPAGGNGSAKGPAAPPSEPALASLRRFGFLDPALGRGEGDFAAIATVGLDPAGYLYVLDVWLARATPSEQITRLFDLHDQWDYEAFGVEINVFQRLLLDPLEAERERRRKAGRRWDVRIDERRHRAGKVERILTLEPLVSGGRLRFNKALSRFFMGQLEEFPTGLHDDGPDAVAAAIELAHRTPAAPEAVASPLRRFRKAGDSVWQY